MDSPDLSADCEASVDYGCKCLDGDSCRSSWTVKSDIMVIPDHPSYRVSMDFRGGGNFLYHISVRLDENKLVFNSRISGVWGTPIVLSPVPLAVGTESLVEIRLDQGMYMLAVDGSSINNFTDRYPNEILEDVSISGDANLTAAHISI